MAALCALHRVPSGTFFPSYFGVTGHWILRSLWKSLKMLAFALLMLGIGSAAAFWWWLERPATMASSPVDLSVDPGMSARAVATAVNAAGADLHPGLLYAWFRLSGESRNIKAGSYELEQGLTPRALLQTLTQGNTKLASITFIEGWTFAQMRQALAKTPSLKPDSAELSTEALMAQLGRSGEHPEGRFFPDTYSYAKGSSDLALLRRSLRAMDKKLSAAWEQRSANSPLQNPGQVLILASIVEKETGRAAERPMISSVFINRLRRGMLLQTDPTVIYGMGERFDGNLRKADLLADTPWNTYTRAGLPPTPIAMPGSASLMAAVRPAESGALYFVARGDGSSAFSATLEEHNRAVNKYQRKR